MRSIARISAVVLFIVLAAAFPDTLKAQSVNESADSFKFTKIDTDLLDEANSVDAAYEKKGLVMHDAALQAYVDSVGRRVIGSRPAPEHVEFKFLVLRDPMVNAFALPNGTVYATTGLLALLENEAQLAGVLGHEAGHVFERHSYMQNRSVRKKAMAVNILAIAGSVGGAVPGAGAAAIFGAAVYAGSEVSSLVLIATMYGYSRDMERQADSDGIAAMTAASYDPHALARSFQLLDDDSKLEFEPFDSFYHDHPKLTERLETALKFADEHTPAKPVTGDTKDYIAAVAPAVVYNISSDIGSRRARSALARSERLVTLFPDDPRYQVLLAQSYRALGAKTRTPTPIELTDHGQSEHRKEYFKMTEQEEQARLLKDPEGQASLKDNRAQSEKILLDVSQKQPDYAIAFRELGFLYEDEARFTDAASQYRKYLGLVASTSMDHLRIERRLDSVNKKASLSITSDEPKAPK
jgi:predicted Zn-dependent protease